MARSKAKPISKSSAREAGDWGTLEVVTWPAGMEQTKGTEILLSVYLEPVPEKNSKNVRLAVAFYPSGKDVVTVDLINPLPEDQLPELPNNKNFFLNGITEPGTMYTQYVSRQLAPTMQLRMDKGHHGKIEFTLEAPQYEGCGYEYRSKLADALEFIKAQ